MRKKLIIALTMVSILNLSSNAFASTQIKEISSEISINQQINDSYNELNNPVVIENEDIELPDNFISDISLVENNITNISDINIKKSVDEVPSSRMYYYEMQKVNTLATQNNVFIKKHPMNYWAKIPSQKPYFEVGAIRTVTISGSTAYNWNTGASISLGVSASKSQSVSSPVRAYANKYCTVGIFSDVRPTRYYEIKRVKGNGQIVSKTPVTVYTPLNTKYDGVYQGQTVKGINGKSISIKN